jgi:MFS family permease
LEETMTEAVVSAPAPGGAAAEPASAEAPHAPLVSAGFRRYALIILLLVYTVNFLDRQIVTVLAEPIKNDLGISDTQLGLLTGFAFGIIYVGLGLPLARLADRFNRVWIIGGSLAVWSAFTMVCGRAMTFPTLVAARMGVAVGEAGCTPTAHALIADYTPREKRASALAFFSLGTPIGSVIGLAAGGVIADAYGWRHAFLLAGLPGLVLAVVVCLTLREPRNAMAPSARRENQAAQMSFVATAKYLAGKPTFWFLAFAAAIKAFIGYGQAPFLISFFLRVHGDQLAALAAPFGLKPLGFMGVVLGPVAGILAAASTLVGGAIGDRFGARDLRAYVSVPAVAALISLPFFCAAMLVRDAGVAFLCLIPSSLLGSLWYGPVYAAAQGLVPPQMRATAASIVLFVINMMGLGFGALTVGALSDVFNLGLGLGKAEGVRWALICSALLGVVSALLFWLARRRIREEMVS